MPTPVDLLELERLLARDTQLVEVLPEAEYEEGHLPGAISLPLKELTRQRAAALNPKQPVVVYCWDSL